MGAVAAGHRGIFDDGDFGILRAKHFVRQRAGLQQLVHVDRAAGLGNFLRQDQARRSGECRGCGRRGQEGGAASQEGVSHRDRTPDSFDFAWIYGIEDVRTMAFFRLNGG